MNRSYRDKKRSQAISAKELSWKTAFHEAGHAAAIYLGNRQKQLPPVFFQIHIKRLSDSVSKKNDALSMASDLWWAKVEGGRLIHTLPSSIEEATVDFSLQQKQAYLKAFEADIVNLLVGPLAEANYIAIRDDEIINARLVHLSSLHNYGGASDLKVVEDYLDCFAANCAQREQKLAELFAVAFDFINEGANWRAIAALASFLLKRKIDVIEYEEVATVLAAHFFPQKRPPSVIRNGARQITQYQF